MFIYICQDRPCLQFTKKLNNWNLKEVCLVVCGCLLVVCGCFWSLPVLVTTRLHSIKNKLDRHPDLKRECHEILHDYIEKEIIEKVDDQRIPEKTHYLLTEPWCDKAKKQQNFALFVMAQQKLVTVHI